MASLAAACRISARLLHGRAARSLSTSSRLSAAQNFIMPALSPTMTEGNIASWKVNEGEPFSAGDVLLEIETDKATMDVEAQEDGIMMKIMTQGGSKAVQVGTRIAVIAEAGDDIAALEIPADEKPAQQPSSSSPSETSPASSSAPTARANTTSTSAGAGTYQHRYPLMPAVGQLVRENGLSKEDVSRIKGTGPHGRLLKGDVLAFLGAIGADSPGAVSARFKTLSHLDLSNIKVAPAPAAAPTPPQPEIPVAAAAAAAGPANIEVQVALSLLKVMDLQRDLAKKIGVSIKVSDLISRAARLANEDLGPAPRAPTASELFDELLGLDTLKRARRGHYLPLVSAVVPAPAARPAAKPDIIDILAAGPGTRTRGAGEKKRNSKTLARGAYGAESVLSLMVPRGEKKRAEQFLVRCKDMLELYPRQLLEL